MVGPEGWQMGDRVHSTNRSNPHRQRLRISFCGCGFIVIEAEQRSQLPPTGATDHSNAIGIDPPESSISNQLADRVPAVKLLCRKMTNRAGPITNCRHRIPMVRQPEDRAVVAVNQRPVLTWEPDNQREPALPAATRQKDVEALMLGTFCVGNVAVVGP